MLISQRLEKLANDYDDSRRTVSLYLLDDPHGAVERSMARIAQDTFTSKATLVRIAQQLGFSGWTEFSRAYLVEVERQRDRAAALNIDHNVPFSAGAPMREIMDAVALVRSESAWQTRQIADERAYEQAARLVFSARHIYLVGASTSKYVLKLFWKKLLDIGVASTIIPLDDSARTLGLAGEGDVVVAVSYSGENARRNPLRFIPPAKERGAAVVAVTGEGDSFLREIADVTLTILSNERLYDKVSVFSSEASTECVLDMLFAGVFALDYERNMRRNACTNRTSDANRLPLDAGGDAEGW